MALESPELPNPREEVQQMTLKIKSELRRSCLYVVVGVIIAVVLAVALKPVRQVSLLEGVLSGVVVVAVFLLCLYVQTWRLRIDDTGIARRRLGRWSYWTWRDFSCGRVRVCRDRLSFSNSARSWWDRWLLLEFVESDEAANKVAEFLQNLIVFPLGKLPTNSPVVVPGEVVIRVGFSCRLHFLPCGIEVHRGCQVRPIDWNQVDTLRLIREPSQRVINFRLETRLRGDGKICGGVCSVRIDGRRIWALRDPKADWPRRLASIVPPRCWQDFSTTGQLQSPEEGAFRLSHFSGMQLRTCRLRAMLTSLCLLLGILVYVPMLIAGWNAQFFPPWWKAVAVICQVLCMIQPAVMVWAILHFSLQSTNRRLNQTVRQMAELETSGPDAGQSQFKSNQTEKRAKQPSRV